ncbi:cytochrome P450, partial [Kitasatospora sp. A2-31]|nr:cytochrome P450 [Kitasatospora sp. A2-31]MCG6500485.1 cytochrome P450 [Kitasatospora sp. A2-31]
MTATPKPSKYWMFTNEFTQNPFPILEYIRSQGPVCEVPLPGAGRAWVVTRYEEAKEALADPRLSRDIHYHYKLIAERTGQRVVPPPENSNHLANLEPPRHTPLRRAISFAFTPRRAEAMRPKVVAMADELLDK